MKKLQRHTAQGMSKDFSLAKFPNTLLLDARNIRITASKDTSIMEIANERGNLLIRLLDTDGNELEDNRLKGDIIGSCIINEQMVLFAHSDDDKPDRIYVLNKKDETSFTVKELYNGNLNFNPKYPIEALGYYENPKSQKVYWIDGLNPDRAVNIAETDENISFWNDDSFNFAQTLTGQEEVVIVKRATGGMFPAGCVQYLCTYYNTYGAESAPFYVSPLFYTTSQEKGVAADTNSPNSFSITIKNIDNRYGNINIYSIIRTSLDAVPGCKLVSTISKKNYEENNGVYSATITDNNLYGSNYSVEEIPYLGSESISSKTISQKDNVLFLGNYRINQPIVSDSITQDLRTVSIQNSVVSTIEDTDVRFTQELSGNQWYNYRRQLDWSSLLCKGFKGRETYRFGVQFQHKSGKWSEAVWIGDTSSSYPSFSSKGKSIFTANVSEDLRQQIIDLGFIKCRPLIVLPQSYEREVVAQGIVNPTVFNIEDREENMPFAQASWFYRPDCGLDGDMPTSSVDGAFWEYRHFYPIPSYKNRNAEISVQGDTNDYPWNYGDDSVFTINKEMFYVDRSIVTLNSPDIEYDSGCALDNCSFRLIGCAQISGNSSNIIIETDEPPFQYKDTSKQGYGFYKKTVTHTEDDGKGNLGANPYWFDALPDKLVSNDYTYNRPIAFVVYPFNRTGSLSLYTTQDSKQKSLLKTKNFINYKFCEDSIYFDDNSIYDDFADYTSSVTLFDLDTSTYMGTDGAYYGKNGVINYAGNLDRLITPTLSSAGYYYTKSYNGDTSENSYINVFVFACYDDNNESKGSVEVELVSDQKYEFKMLVSVVTHGHAVYEAYEYLPDDYETTILEEAKTKATDIGASNVVLTQIYIKGFSGRVKKDTSDGIPIVISAEKRWEYDSPNVDYENIFNGMWQSACKDASKGGFNAIYHTTTTTARQDYYVNYIAYDLGCDPEYGATTNSAYMCYNSIKHAVINLGNPVEVNGTKRYMYLPYFTSNSYHTIWDTNLYTVPIDEQSTGGNGRFVGLEKESWPSTFDIANKIKNSNIVPDAYQPTFWLGELYRTYDKTTKFGGQTDSALANNTWQIAGEEQTIATNTDGFTIEWLEGDTFYQRYDSVKTVPNDTEFENGIVDVASVMIESRVNLDALYDNNKGTTALTHLLSTNYSKQNTVYDQNDNFFSYFVLDEATKDLNEFSNSITWTNAKVSGSKIDSWQNINLLSTYDLDGLCGALTSLKYFNDRLFAIQEHGFSQVLYNESTALSDTSGGSIEVAKSGKMNGVKYLSNTIGTNNKWGVLSNYDGLFFHDTNNNALYAFRETFTSLSDEKGMSSWVQQEYADVTSWDVDGFDNVRTNYDPILKELYFTYHENTLVFNLLVNQFTSFYDYGNIPFVSTIDGETYSVENSQIWKFRAGEYNMFNGNYKPFSISLVAKSEEEEHDIILDNAEFLSDAWSDNTKSEHINVSPFNKIEVYNDYQNSDGELEYSGLIKDTLTSPLRRKFRIFRANIPRPIRQKGRMRDRIRNHSSVIRLIHDAEDVTPVSIQDIIVNYSI